MKLHPRRVRALFISDLHLGTHGCQASLVLDFLRHHEADRIYLIGDIVDGWRLKKKAFWPQSHNDIVQKLLRKGRKGAKIYYTPGNHDEVFRKFLGMQFGGVRVANQTVHVTRDGRRLLVLHGDKYDAVVRHHKWLAVLGAHAYESIYTLSTLINLIRRRMGLSYWSLSACLKRKVKNAMTYITKFRDVALEDAAAHGYDGIVCGHIHQSASEQVEGLWYYNTGDWVETCTAVIEEMDGTMRAIEWTRPAEGPEVVDKPKSIKTKAAAA